MKKNLLETKMVVLLGLLIAMSVIGSYIKIPNPITGSVAFDSFPAFAGALVLGGIPGAVIGFFGHMVSAAITGFPLSLPIHILVGLQMAVIMFVYSFVAKRLNLVAASIVAILLNGIAAPACFIVVPGMGMPVFIALIPVLLLASAANVLVAYIVYKSMENSKILSKLQDH